MFTLKLKSVIPATLAKTDNVGFTWIIPALTL
jgi:hypothetical protein